MSGKKINKPVTTGNNMNAIKPKWQHILLIIFLTAIVYSNTLHNDFAYDDSSTIVHNRFIRSVSNIFMFFTEPVISTEPNFETGYRPLTMTSFTINYVLGGLNVIGYHLVNLLFHLGNAVMVYVLVIAFLGLPKSNTDNRIENVDKSSIALFVSLIFAVHPINSEAVNYIWQRSELMSAFFYLAAIIMLLKSFYNKSKYSVLSIFAFLLALLSKETAITLPLIIVLLDWYFISKYNKDKFMNNVKRHYLPYILIAFLFIIFRFIGEGGIVKNIDSPVKINPIEYLLTQFKVIIIYLKLIFIPYGLSVSHEIIVSNSIMDIKVFMSFTVISILLYISGKIRKYSSFISFFMLWFFIILIPTSSVLPLQIIMNEHRPYLSGIGVFFIFVLLLYKYTSKRIKKYCVPVVLVMILVIFSAITYRRNLDWKDGFTLWSKNIVFNPDSRRSYISRGSAYAAKGLYNRAIMDFNRAIDIHPGHSTGYYNRGLAYKKTGKYNEAIRDFSKAIEINYKYADAYNNRGVIYGMLGLYNKALNDFDKAIKYNPFIIKALDNKEITYQKMKAGLKKELNDDTVNKDSEVFRGSINNVISLIEKGKLDAALALSNKLIETNPNSSEAYNKRGVIYGMKSNYRKAVVDFSKSIELDPLNAEAYNNRSYAYKFTGKPGLAKNDKEKARALQRKLTE